MDEKGVSFFYALVKFFHLLFPNSHFPKLPHKIKISSNRRLLQSYIYSRLKSIWDVGIKMCFSSNYFFYSHFPSQFFYPNKPLSYYYSTSPFSFSFAQFSCYHSPESHHLRRQNACKFSFFSLMCFFLKKLFSLSGFLFKSSLLSVLLYGLLWDLINFTWVIFVFDFLMFLLLLLLQVFVPPHPLIKHWVSVLRNEQTPCAVFSMLKYNLIAAWLIWLAMLAILYVIWAHKCDFSSAINASCWLLGCNLSFNCIQIGFQSERSRNQRAFIARIFVIFNIWSVM